MLNVYVDRAPKAALKEVRLTIMWSKITPTMCSKLSRRSTKVSTGPRSTAACRTSRVSGKNRITGA